MRMRKRARVNPAGDQSGEVGHVDEKARTDRVRDLAHAAEIDHPRIGRAARDQHFGPVLVRELLDVIVVDAMIVAAHAIGHDLEPLARHVDRRAVGQVAAGGEIEPHEGIAGLHQRHEGRRIGGGAGMRLHVCEFTSEKPGNPFNREVFRDIHVLAAAVVALARQALGILVGEDGALGFEHRAADDIFRRNQLDLIALATEFEADGLGDLRIGLPQRGGEQGIGLQRPCWLLRWLTLNSLGLPQIGAACESVRTFGARGADSTPAAERQALAYGAACCRNI